MENIKIGRLSKEFKQSALSEIQQFQTNKLFIDNLGSNETDSATNFMRPKAKKVDLDPSLITIRNMILTSTPKCISFSDKLMPNTNFKLNYLPNENFHLIFGLLRDSTYQLYVTYSQKYQPHILRAENLIEKQFLIFNPISSSLKEVWDFLIRDIKNDMPNLLAYVKSLPGFSNLSNKDLNKILTLNLFSIYVFSWGKCFIRGECFYLLMNKFQFTKYWMNLCLGTDATQLIFDLALKFEILKISTNELALLVPLVLIETGLALNQQAIAQSNLRELYKTALLKEFNMNKRNDSFVQEVVKVNEFS
jgi:hypothetical protein